MPRFRRPRWLPAWMFSTATGWLIVANVAIWFGMVIAATVFGGFGAGLWAPFPGGLTDLFGAMIPPLVPHEPWRLITSAFLHAGLLHVALNMFLLWYLGLRLESAFGYGRFLVLYMGAALGGAIVSYLWHSIVGGTSVGASGAVLGVLGGLFALSWKGLGFNHPATRRWWMFAVIGFALGIVGSLLGAEATDNAAHLGGWAAGIGIALLFAGKRPWDARLQKGAAAVSVVAVVASFLLALMLGTGLSQLSERGEDRAAAIAAINAEDYPSAENALARAIHAEPKDMDLRIVHASILDKLGNKDGATAELAAAASLDGSPDQFGRLAEAFRAQGDLAAARKAAAAARVKSNNAPRFERLYQEIKAASEKP